jgi:hypothetical protein
VGSLREITEGAHDQRDDVGLVEAWQNKMTSPDEDEVQSEPPRNVAADPQPKAQEAPKPDCTGDTAITLVGRSMIRSPDKGREQINGGYRAHLPVTSFLGRVVLCYCRLQNVPCRLEVALKAARVKTQGM